MRHLSFLIILLSLVGGVETHAEVRSPVKVVERRIAMGVEARVVLYAPDEASGRAAARKAFARIEQVERAISSWRASSQNRRMCERPGEVVELHEDLFQVLARSLSEGLRVPMGARQGVPPTDIRRAGGTS